MDESRGVLHARSRSERDVRSFLQSGLADEQVRVGAVLQELFKAALDVDWESVKVRRTASPIPPVAMANPNLRLLERLTFSDATKEEERELDLSENASELGDLGDDFRAAFEALDRGQLFEETLKLLKTSGRALTMAKLARHLPPSHDLETLSYWLAMAREAGVVLSDEVQRIDLEDNGEVFRFTVPEVGLEYEASQNLSLD